MDTTRFLPSKFYPHIKPDKRGWVNSLTNEVIIACHGLIADGIELMLNANTNGEQLVVSDFIDDPMGVRTIKEFIFNGVSSGGISVQDNDTTVMFNFNSSDWFARGNTMIVTIVHNLNTKDVDAIIKDEVGRILNIEYATPTTNSVELIITDSPDAIFTGTIHLTKVT